MILNFRTYRFFMVLALLSLLEGGCGFYSGNASTAPLITTCTLPTDQSATLSGKWPALPIPVAFNTGQFSTNDYAAVAAAADTWNSFFNAVQSQKVLNYGTSTTSPTLTTATDAANGNSNNECSSANIIPGGSVYTGTVGIYKLTTWPYGSAVIALTTTCSTPSSPTTSVPLPPRYAGVIEINYQGFFVQQPSGVSKIPDAQSILLHEFGHLLGSKHSCEPGGTATGMPDCSSSAIDPNYLSASMFPTFYFDSYGNGNQKRTLNINDEGRALCLYEN